MSTNRSYHKNVTSADNKVIKLVQYNKKERQKSFNFYKNTNKYDKTFNDLSEEELKVLVELIES